MRTVHQINLQRHFGGGEVYTRFLCAALSDLGWPVQLYVSTEADFWTRLGLSRLPGVRVVPVATMRELEGLLPDGSLVVTHAPFGMDDEGARWAARHTLTGFLHMPLAGRDPAGLARYARVFGVSRYVVEGARAAGLGNVWPQPLYGVADLERGETVHAGSAGVIRRGSVYDWDRRKVRDRLLGTLSPLAAPLRSTKTFARSPGLTLGIVSRLTPIKQFPLLFQHLAPVIARVLESRHVDINIEIFGSGGYASVRDLRRALAPVGARARFWGQQQDVRAVYTQLDYVLSGLPEKEALGLNLIEAQACGTPVLAVKAPPFTETVVDGASGYLFEDPRADGGKSFGALLERLVAGAPRPDPRRNEVHLARFGMVAFRERLAAAMRDLDERK